MKIFKNRFKSLSQFVIILGSFILISSCQKTGAYYAVANCDDYVVLNFDYYNIQSVTQVEIYVDATEQGCNNDNTYSKLTYVRPANGWGTGNVTNQVEGKFRISRPVTGLFHVQVLATSDCIPTNTAFSSSPCYGTCPTCSTGVKSSVQVYYGACDSNKKCSDGNTKGKTVLPSYILMSIDPNKGADCSSCQ